MIDLVYWSFVVALSPIAIGAGFRCLAAVLGPLGRPGAAPHAWHESALHAPHYAPGRVGRMGGFGHGH